MLGVAVSLGWSAGDFLVLERDFIEKALANEDEYHYVSFDWRRHKTKARTLGILVPSAVVDLSEYLKRVPRTKKLVWTITMNEGVNQWLKGLVKQAGIKAHGSIRFHLFRKYTFPNSCQQL